MRRAVFFEIHFGEEDLGASGERLAAYSYPRKMRMTGVRHDATRATQPPAFARISRCYWATLDDVGAQESLGYFISDRQAELPRREFGRSRFLIQLEESIHRSATPPSCARP
jgi:hypothetical protein